MEKTALKFILTLFLTSLIWIGCVSKADDTETSSPAVEAEKEELISRPDGFNAYWFAGEAELTSYKLEQARYGEIHQGEAVLIYVTEDISRSKQVKLDDPASAGDDRVKVLKLNATKNFVTGIYPYSLMTSTFMAIDFSNKPAVLKVSASSQDWCGHSFTQLNATANGYRYESRSYFESEGDSEKQVARVFPENELWIRIRMGPEALPVGEIDVLPDLQFHRLRHTPFREEKAVASIQENPDASGGLIYQVDYSDLDRSFKVFFNAKFPHDISGWEERNQSGFGPDTAELVTKATRITSMNTDYWRHNNLADKDKRTALGLR